MSKPGKSSLISSDCSFREVSPAMPRLSSSQGQLLPETKLLTVSVSEMRFSLRRSYSRSAFSALSARPVASGCGSPSWMGAAGSSAARESKLFLMSIRRLASASDSRRREESACSDFERSSRALRSSAFALLRSFPRSFASRVMDWSFERRESSLLQESLFQFWYSATMSRKPSASAILRSPSLMRSCQSLTVPSSMPFFPRSSFFSLSRADISFLWDSERERSFSSAAAPLSLTSASIAAVRSRKAWRSFVSSSL